MATIWPPFEVEVIHFEFKRRIPRFALETILAEVKVLLPVDCYSPLDNNKYDI